MAQCKKTAAAISDIYDTNIQKNGAVTGSTNKAIKANCCLTMHSNTHTHIYILHCSATRLFMAKGSAENAKNEKIAALREYRMRAPDPSTKIIQKTLVSFYHIYVLLRYIYFIGTPTFSSGCWNWSSGVRDKK